jgi:hypothetical protein
LRAPIRYGAGRARTGGIMVIATPTRPAAMRLLPITLTLAVVSVAVPALADSTTTFTLPNGETVTRNIMRAPGSVSSTTTGPDGRSVERQWTRDRANGTISGSVTGPEGRTATRARTRDRAAGTASAVTTGPNGRSVTRDRSWDRDDRILNGTVIGPRGNSRSRSTVFER